MRSKIRQEKRMKKRKMLLKGDRSNRCDTREEERKTSEKKRIMKGNESNIGNTCEEEKERRKKESDRTKEKGLKKGIGVIEVRFVKERKGKKRE